MENFTLTFSLLPDVSAAVKVSRFQDFSMEAFFMSQLRHDNVVRLLGLCLRPMCLVTEFIAYGDLYHLLQDPATSFPTAFVLRIAYDIAAGMR